MNFKDAFHYQNTLDCLFDDAALYLVKNENVTRKTQEHMRSKADPSASDETVDATDQSRTDSIDFPVSRIVDFMCAVMDEKIKLTEAIEKAKRGCEVLLDVEVSANKMRRRTQGVVFNLSKIRNKTFMSTASDYRINAEGNQVLYKYPVKETVVPDFDPMTMRKLSNSMRNIQGEASQRIETMLLMTEVDFEPSFDVDDTNLHSAIEAFVNRVGDDAAESAYERRYERHAL